jgi:hypothetical protein
VSPARAGVRSGSRGRTNAGPQVGITNFYYGEAEFYLSQIADSDPVIQQGKMEARLWLRVDPIQDWHLDLKVGYGGDGTIKITPGDYEAFHHGGERWTLQVGTPPKEPSRR